MRLMESRDCHVLLDISERSGYDLWQNTLGPALGLFHRLAVLSLYLFLRKQLQQH